MCRDHHPTTWPGLAEKGAKIWVKYGLGGCHMGRQGLGSNWVDLYRCQDAFPGLVGPFWATGGRFGAIFHIFRMSNIFRIIFPIFLLFPYSPGVVCPYYSPVWGHTLQFSPIGNWGLHATRKCFVLFVATFTPHVRLKPIPRGEPPSFFAVRPPVNNRPATPGIIGNIGTIIQKI